jgi:hypothetical protein
MPLLAPVVHWMTLPARLTVAAAQTTLALGQLVDVEGPVRRRDGYADRLMLLIGEGGLVERLARALADPQGPMRLVNVIVDALDPERPLGRAIAPGGPVDRLLDPEGPLFRLLEEGGTVDRLVEVDGPLDRLVTPGGPLDRLLAVDGALDRITQPGGVLDRLLAEQGLLDRLLTEDGFVEKLIVEGGTLDQLIALGATLERIQPRLGELARVIPELHASVDALNQAVGPLGELANRIPGRRRAAALES